MKYFQLYFILFGLLISCKKTNYNPTYVSLEYPNTWPKPNYYFINNPLTTEGIFLGRKLFYDGILSKDGNFACNECHAQPASFGTLNHDLSHGYGNTHNTRNAPTLQNLAWQTSFRWDGGTNSIEQLILQHLNHPNEMGEKTEDVLKKLRAHNEYPQLFRDAFGTGEISSDRLTKSITQFVLTLINSKSKYDLVTEGKASFNVSENAGYAIFKAKCNSCHTEPLFTDLQYRNTGLPLNYLLDFGRKNITNLSSDSLKFKVPTLRNTEVSGYYTHDGRFQSVLDVLEHYRSGVANGPTTDVLVKNKIPLTNSEMGQLTSFLFTLTDTTLTKGKKFSAPE